MLKIGDKVVWFTDIHLGLRSNEKRHNEECLEFIKWMIHEAHEFGARYSIFGGDFHHQRSSVQTATLNYSTQVMNLLNDNFDKHFHIIGNHDLFYKNRRTIHSVPFAKNLKNVQIIDKITPIGDAVLAPWLVDNEHKSITKMTQPYLFGHFELPHFLMNAMVAMPDIGHLSDDAFKTDGQKLFSGHFHKRQRRTNSHGAEIIYTGNCFPHNFSDAGDDERGIMLLELGKEPIFKSWPKAPQYKNLLLSQILEEPEKHLSDRVTAKITIDLEISYEEANFIRTTMAEEYGVREMKLMPTKESLDQIIGDENITFLSINQMVTESINSMESNTMDKALLLQIYNNLHG